MPRNLRKADKAGRTAGGESTVKLQASSRIFAELACSGVHLICCRGDFAISGGVGRCPGIVGGGQLVVRGDFREITLAPGVPATEVVSGILYWPNLRYSHP